LVQQAPSIPIRLIQSHLADLVGASRMQVSRVLHEYRQRGYISIDRRHHVVLHERAALARCCL